MGRRHGNSGNRVWGSGRTLVVLIIRLRGSGKELLREVVVGVGRGRLKVSKAHEFPPLARSEYQGTYREADTCRKASCHHQGRNMQEAKLTHRFVQMFFSISNPNGRLWLKTNVCRFRLRFNSWIPALSAERTNTASFKQHISNYNER